MTADEHAFLQAIIAARDDDLPRLVYADWLEEHGRPERAEFIRVQCELARSDMESIAEVERARLSSRVRELHDTHSHLWRRELPRVTGVRWAGFERGMIGSVLINFCDSGCDNAALDSLFTHAPLRTARVNSHSPWILSKILRWPAFTRFKTLALFDHAPFIAHREMGGLIMSHEWGDCPEVLDLRSSGFDDEVLRVVAQAPGDRIFPIIDLRGYDPLWPGVVQMRNRFGERVFL